MRKQNLTKAEKAALKEIGKQIDSEIKAIGLTDEDFAYRAGVARSTLREIRSGKTNVRICTLSKVVRAAGYDSLRFFMNSRAIGL